MIRNAANRNPLDPPIILAIGRLSEQKNHALLLRAAAGFATAAGDCGFAAPAPRSRRLRALAEELGIGDRLELPGFVDDPRARISRRRR